MRRSRLRQLRLRYNGHAVEKKRDLNAEYLRNLQKSTGPQAIDAFLILLNLLETYPNLPSKLLLRHPCRDPVKSYVAAYDGVHLGGLAIFGIAVLLMVSVPNDTAMQGLLEVSEPELELMAVLYGFAPIA